MNKRLKSLVLIALLVSMAGVAIGQESLKDVVEEQGLSWIVGQWKATMDDGSEILLTYRWAVEGHAMISDLKMGQRSSQGMIYLDADQQQVRQLSVDSRGQVTEATWTAEDGKPIAKTTMTDEYGQATDVGIVYSKVSETTMSVAIHALEDGELSDYPAFEIDFQRKKK